MINRIFCLIHTATHCKASSLPCYSIHGSVYIFDLSLLGSALASVKFTMKLLGTEVLSN